MKPHRYNPLISAILEPEPEAEEAWHKWRADADLDNLDEDSILLLPGLAARLPHWTVEDPRRGVLLGICRRAWSHNQIQNRLLADAIRILNTGGIQRLAPIGPVSWSTEYWPEGSIRPVGRVDLLVEPGQLEMALRVLIEAGWSTIGPLPNAATWTLAFHPAVPLRSPGGNSVWLHWRAIPRSDLSVRRPPPPQWVALPRREFVSYAIPPEYALVGVLAGFQNDAVDWICDVLAVTRKVQDWDLVATLLRHRSRARDRWELWIQDWRSKIPAGALGPIKTSLMERWLAACLRTLRSAASPRR